MKTLERAGYVMEIVRRKPETTRLGKTSLLKLIYLLQEVYGVNLGYRFSLYTYGPYTASVMSDIDYMDGTGILSVEYNGDIGYSIKAGACSHSIERYRQIAVD